ncbi:MAG: hypothetical protein Q8O72_03880 [Bacteroidales bacterium]|nr:hypothetical protein [Bacteroidales bacterium]
MTPEHDKVSLTPLIQLFVISLLTALASYVVLFFISGYSSLYFAYDFDILAKMGLNGVVFQTPAADAKWTFDALVTIYLSKPLTSFFVGLLAILLLMFIHQKSTTWLYFLLWSAIWGLNGSIGSLIDDAIFGENTYAVAKAMDFSFSVLLVSGVLAAYFMYMVGVIIGRLYFVYLRNAPTYQSKERTKWITTTILIPWMFLGLISYLNWLPGSSWWELVKNLTAIILIIPMYFIKDQLIKSTNDRRWSNLNRMDWFFLMAFIALTIWIVFTLAGEVLISG